MGCSQTSENKESRFVYCPPGITVAVAPALNFSGSSAFDGVKVADLMASELTQVSGVGVVGVNRVLAVLAEQGTVQIQSPHHAVMVCERIGADAILVFAITEYDPYRPIVGVAAQLYGRRTAGKSLDPVAASRMARPFPVAPDAEASRPWAEVQRTFNGVHKDVQDLVEDFAERRSGDESPYGWRKYLASQELYLRFCCYTVAADLMSQPLPLETAAYAE